VPAIDGASDQAGRRHYVNVYQLPATWSKPPVGYRGASIKPQSARHAPRGRRIKLPGQYLKSWLADNPYRRAVADTNHEPAQLSATIRCFPSSVQRRRAPRRIHLKGS
jgi:hypothetical protein